MRVFIAIDIPSSIKEKIIRAQETFKTCGVEAKWVKPHNFHLTLKFLGEIKEKDIEVIKKKIDTVARSFSKFDLDLDGFGFFPNQKYPRVFFAKLNEEKVLFDIAAGLEEKNIKSHITLCRFKSNKNIASLLEKLETIPLKDRFKVEAIALFKSTLTKSGPVYEKLSETNLSGL